MVPAVLSFSTEFSGPSPCTEASAHDPAEERRNLIDRATKALSGSRVCLYVLYTHYTSQTLVGYLISKFEYEAVRNSSSYSIYLR